MSKRYRHAVLVVALGVVFGATALADPSSIGTDQKSIPMKGFNLVSGANGELVLNEYKGRWTLLYHNQDVTERAKLQINTVDKHLLLEIRVASDSNLPPLPTTFTLQNTPTGQYRCLGGTSGCAAEIKNWKPLDLR